jgi:predicted nuclease of predicted toxin-antitoxin system
VARDGQPDAREGRAGAPEWRRGSFIDECPSPPPSLHLSATGEHDATHPRDRGRLGESDHVVLARCVAEDRTIVTQNAIDFRKLAAREALHPGPILLPSVARERSLRLLLAAVAYLSSLGKPSDVIVDHVLEVNETGDFTPSAFSKPPGRM